MKDDERKELEEKMTFEECGRYYVQKLMDERSN